jgi:hypothetical protein
MSDSSAAKATSCDITSLERSALDPEIPQDVRPLPPRRV